ncbi:hypothetical protein NA57DRAFT_76992 [Rhizodiscina lignyota]|uniref:HECT-type E3 ubiquitin transferase n=1 Tax=Rhizodiscina lignyota TaxID=1504668 RepID=A0A9P4M9W9_9PEZI|nr:hypothetical protein NA57DRAFT_76992 [Rhizodiscina lignyota]
MSRRVTRSTARISAGQSTSNTTVPPDIPPPPPTPPPHNRKRKAREPSPEQSPPTPEVPPRQRAKRTKFDAPPPPAPPSTDLAPASSRRRGKNKVTAAMSSAGPSGDISDETSAHGPLASTAPASRKKQKSKKSSSDDTPHSHSRSTSSRRTRKGTKHEDDTPVKEEGGDPSNREHSHGRLNLDDDDDDGESAPRYPPADEDDDDDEGPFSGGYLGRHAHGGPLGSMSSTLRALTGMMTGVSSRLRNILENLKQKDDPSVQLIALQELSEVLLVSNEDNLTGHFHPDQYVKELVSLMQGNDFGGGNPEIMLLACRCLANLMEALPASTANVVYGGAVPILCQKLLEIDFIDLAEQALSTLEKISVEFPGSIVREGGLTACLNYLDFFHTSTQRTAVTTAANCCRNIPDDSFPVVREVMPILLNVLSNADQKVLEQGCLCVSRIVESFKYQDDKIEDLINADMLRAILRLLLPGTTNLIGPNIHTQFLRVLSIIARASPKLTVELFKMDVVDTLYQILTGVSPPSGDEDIANKIDSVVIMQALIHRPREQIFETLNVICELLPSVQRDGLTYLDNILDAGYPGPDYLALVSRTHKMPNEKKVELLKECREEVKRFAIILLPTLTDAYSSTVNLNVRQKVLTAQLKMLSNLDVDILEDALRTVPYASYLASILSQQDHPTLVTFALQAAELLLKRLESIYRYQFYREGVISEIRKLADRPCKQLEEKPSKSKASKVVTIESARPHSTGRDTNSSAEDHDMDQDVVIDDLDDDDDEDGSDDDNDENDENSHGRDQSDSDSSSSGDQPRFAPNPELPDIDDLITLQAKQFLEAHENDESKAMRKKAASTLDDLKTLAQEIRRSYLEDPQGEHGDLFVRLARYFDGDALDSVTSYELLTSDVVQILLDVFSDETSQASINARSAFLAAFMGPGTETKQRTSTSASPSTPFSILVHKLQDMLSRAEHFEVITVHSNSFDTGRGSAASMLAKQLRLKLNADEDSGIPVTYRNIMVSIHAIATFKALDDYLRPRISLAERPRGSKSRGDMASAMAAYAAAFGGRGDSGRHRLPIPPPFAPAPGDLADRTILKRGSRAKPPAKSEQESASTPKTKQETPRKSSRRKREEKKDIPLPPPPPPAEETEDTLECADEAKLTDADDSLDDGALDAIVDDLEDEMDEDEPDPDAVNMEVAPTGKVTARKEDGTRIATPLSGAPASKPGSSKPTPTQQALSTPTASSRAMSYAAAIQAVPQDWHLEFSVNDQPINNETTIYRAVHFNPTQPGEVSARNIWQAVHTIKFKRVPGPPPTESSALSPPPETVLSPTTGLPASLDKNPTTSGILRLLSILHGLNSNIDDVLTDHHSTIKLNAEPLSQFVNTKLTAKLNRQMEEPLIVASNCLPSWSEDLARFYPFLFPFETRHLFLQSTSFGYSRSMTRWQNAQDSNGDSRHRHRDERPFLGRLQRQKVRISRTRILESAVKVMELYGSSPSILEVEYFEEVGTGLGPTLEFYSTVSKEFSKKKLKLWRENDSNDADDYAFGKGGLFPAPMSDDQAISENGKKILHLFRILGKFVARSMLDSRIIDVSFNPTFFRIANTEATGGVTPSLGAVRSVDADLANSLKVVKRFASAKKRIDENPKLSAAQKVSDIQDIEIDGAKVEDLALDFTLPGYPSVELVPNGANVNVTMDNVCEYVNTVLDMTLGKGVKKQIESFKEGFGLVFPYAAVRAFTPEELVMLFGRVDEDWSLETLMDSIKADHGFNLDSKSVRNLLTVMSDMDPQQRRNFLQFVTGSPKLPIGGFKALTPMFTVVCKPSEPPYTSDDYLPSVMTCVNYLKLPDYSTLDAMRMKLDVAIKEGQGAFHLS